MELICVDLEFRWRQCSRDPVSHDRRLLESYAGSSPNSALLDRLPIELIDEEYRVRRVWGDRPKHAEFFSRFPARHEQLRTELPRIDREIDEELAGSCSNGIKSPATSACAIHAEFEQIRGIPFFSHQDILLKRMIGAGKMGKVYQAWHHNLKREIAAKFLRKGLLHEPALVQRFIGEAITIAKLHHPNIVGIHGLGRTPSGAYFIVMELVTGPDLDLLARPNAISVEESISWAMELCDALEHAQRRGLSTAISNPRISYSMSTGGCASRTLVLLAHLPVKRPGPPRSKGPHRSWRRNRFPVLGTHWHSNGRLWNRGGPLHAAHRPAALVRPEAAGYSCQGGECRAGHSACQPPSRLAAALERILPEVPFQGSRGPLSKRTRSSLGFGHAERRDDGINPGPRCAVAARR